MSYTFFKIIHCENIYKCTVFNIRNVIYNPCIYIHTYLHFYIYNAAYESHSGNDCCCVLCEVKELVFIERVCHGYRLCSL